MLQIRECRSENRLKNKDGKISWKENKELRVEKQRDKNMGMLKNQSKRSNIQKTEVLEKQAEGN